MSHVPGAVDTEYQPPMAIPLAHFLVAIFFLLAGLGVGLLISLGALQGFATLAHIHLFLIGWVCVTIMGAMTQFVPVWSGVRLHSRRLAVLQLVLATLGLAGFAGALLTGTIRVFPVAGGLLAVGLWLFVYNIARSLPKPTAFDVTERHFALALAFFTLVPLLGLLLGIDLVVPLLGPWGIPRHAVVASHATLAVFGAVLTTIFGALYQLATMFTQTALHGVDQHLQRIEEFCYPLGVVLLAGGRLFSVQSVATLGGLLLLLGVAAFAAILLRRLVESRLGRTSMIDRYAVVGVAMVLWVLVTLPTWIDSPTRGASLFGGSTPLLLFGVVGFTVFGSLYHIVPFIVWVHRYGDMLGYEPVPMVDELYTHRLASVDFWTLVAGTACLVVDSFGGPARLGPIGIVAISVGGLLFAVNIAIVVHEHAAPDRRDAVLSRIRKTVLGRK
ncbi:hypothetical protein Halar_1536 [halophilic archaeon DL31]|jgi:hypothetical protein|nr:hypothetical protein Halar_1536 [halophilic archaeon DL31]